MSVLEIVPLYKTTFSDDGSLREGILKPLQTRKM